MRHLMLIVLLCVLVATATAQEQTLYKGGITTSGFGGPVVKYTAIGDHGVVMLGGRGGWIFNHALVLGGGAYGTVTEIDAPAGVVPGEDPVDIKFEYGGFEAEYIFHSNALTHATLYTLIGGGTIRFVKDVGPVSESNDQVGESEMVFVLEPGVGGELNVTTWFRLGAGVSYRVVTGVGRGELTNSDFAGVAGTLTFKFGRF